MCEDSKYQILELIEWILEAIDIVLQRTLRIKKSNDFLLTPGNTLILDSVCMKLIFIGESIKNIDKISKGELLANYPVLPWKEVMKLRDLIAHHYFKIDVDIIFSTVKEDIPLLHATLLTIQDHLKSPSV